MNQALYQSATETFEEISYIFPEERDPRLRLKVEDCINIGIDFSGPLNGRIGLRIERRVLPVVAANMLGEEAPFSDEIILDVAGELTNVICGNALPFIGGKNAVFDLSAPQVLESAELHSKPSAEANIVMDEGSADVLLYLT